MRIFKLITRTALSVLLQLPLTELTAGRVNIRTQLAPHGCGNAALLERLLDLSAGEILAEILFMQKDSGETISYSINMSGKDGSVILTEFLPCTQCGTAPNGR